MKMRKKTVIAKMRVKGVMVWAAAKMTKAKVLALLLVVEVLFVSTGIVFFTHILIPSLIMKDITQIKRRLMDNIRDFNDKVNKVLGQSSTVGAGRKKRRKTREPAR